MTLPIQVRPELGTALVVGGGAVARRKVFGLLDAGFCVTVVAPRIDGEIERHQGVDLVRMEYSVDLLEGHVLVFACTNQREVNRGVGEHARRAGIPVLVADAPEESTFWSPAVHRRGALSVAVSTGGADPALAQTLRDRIAAMLEGEDVEDTVRRAEADRAARRSEAHD